MKATMLACAAGVFLCPSAAPISAQGDVVVQSPPSLAAWSATIGHRLDGTLRYPERIWSGSRTDGVARVAFRCSDDGRPSEVKLMRSSGVPELDREALRAVRLIKTLQPLAQGIGHDQRYAAVLIFATSQRSLNIQRAELAQEDRLAASWPRGAVGRLALVGPISDTAQ